MGGERDHEPRLEWAGGVVAGGVEVTCAGGGEGGTSLGFAGLSKSKGEGSTVRTKGIADGNDCDA